MGMSKKAVVLLIPSLWFGLGAPAWSGTSEQAAPQRQATSAAITDNNLLGMLNWVLTGTDPSPRQPKNQCNASQPYSQHDVVGDPEACLMGRYSIGSGSTTAVSLP